VAPANSPEDGTSRLHNQSRRREEVPVTHTCSPTASATPLGMATHGGIRRHQSGTRKRGASEPQRVRLRQRSQRLDEHGIGSRPVQGRDSRALAVNATLIPARTGGLRKDVVRVAVWTIVGAFGTRASGSYGVRINGARCWAVVRRTRGRIHPGQAPDSTRAIGAQSFRSRLIRPDTFWLAEQSPDRQACGRAPLARPGTAHRGPRAFCLHMPYPTRWIRVTSGGQLKRTGGRYMPTPLDT
jgi:hypothetical protein